MTLENLTRPQLVSMCRYVPLKIPAWVATHGPTGSLTFLRHSYMNINAFGTDIFLRFTIRNRLAKLKQDDQVRRNHSHTFPRSSADAGSVQVIDSEGLDALSSTELQSACQSRGIRTIGVSEDHLRSELQQWLDLHLHYGLSGTLLILSKAFAFNRAYGTEPAEGGDEIMRSLKDTLASLPDNLVRFPPRCASRRKMLTAIRLYRSTRPSSRCLRTRLRTSSVSRFSSNRRSSSRTRRSRRRRRPSRVGRRRRRRRR